jgi:hypothetical protein
MINGPYNIKLRYRESVSLFVLESYLEAPDIVRQRLSKAVESWSVSSCHKMYVCRRRIIARDISDDLIPIASLELKLQ